MKSKQRKNYKLRNWVVATQKDIDSAARKGLYKTIISFPPKTEFKISIAHISDMKYFLRDYLSQQVRKWLELSEERFIDHNEQYHILFAVEKLLYILEDLMPYEDIYKNPLNPGLFNYDNESFFTILRFLRNIIAFPTRIEKFYKSFEKVYRQKMAKGDIYK